MYKIAEVAQAHDGSLGNAISFVKAVASTGFDAIKFQHHIATEESTIHDQFRVGGFPQDDTRFAYWERTSFEDEEWLKISNACKENNIDLVVSPFSERSVELCEKLDVARYKIGSGEISNYSLIDKCIKTGKQVILSSGMSSWAELDDLMARYSDSLNDIGLMHCVSKYPCGLNEIGLDNVDLIKQRYRVKTGLSDHSSDGDVGKICGVLGFDFYECHVCWSRDMFGPDTSSSLTIEELRSVADFLEKYTLMKSGQDKDSIALELSKTRQLFGKRLVANLDLERGTILKNSDIGFKKPGGGMDLRDLSTVIGRRLKVSLFKDDPIVREVLDD